ncbi:MaoC domain protein dehydratase [mine drainage metagenome]|uniref:MaoC domain protein dehydratase n=1 Tax=mine drainage metagenome TaxID=410659 RepID=T1AAL8_9ZZZZ
MFHDGLKPGDAVPELVKDPVTKVQLLKYAGASGDYNLIHTDVETARAVGLPDVIAHGMLSMGFLGQFLTELAGPSGVRQLKVRFAAMVHLGDVITCRGVVRSVRPQEGNRAAVALEVSAENQRGERVTVGDAEVWLQGQ